MHVHMRDVVELRSRDRSVPLLYLLRFLKCIGLKSFHKTVSPRCLLSQCGSPVEERLPSVILKELI